MVKIAPRRKGTNLEEATGMNEQVSRSSLERRRTIRIRRSGLLRWQLDDIDRPAIKVAETVDELKQAFTLVHDTYLEMGYLDEPRPHQMLFTVHTLLPDSVVFVVKSYQTVLSTVTEIFDTQPFGLPMDALYRKEVDQLREKGRRIVELSALVTPKKLRWRNLFMYMNQVMYQYSLEQGVDDICIMINPKHVQFYQDILMFETLGPERYYPKVRAPAVALRINMDVVSERAKEEYSQLDLDCNLHDYFRNMEYRPGSCSSDVVPQGNGPSGIRRLFHDAGTVRQFLDMDGSLAEDLNPDQRLFLNDAYPGLSI